MAVWREVADFDHRMIAMDVIAKRRHIERLARMPAVPASLGVFVAFPARRVHHVVVFLAAWEHRASAAGRTSRELINRRAVRNLSGFRSLGVWFLFHRFFVPESGGVITFFVLTLRCGSIFYPVANIVPATAGSAYRVLVQRFPHIFESPIPFVWMMPAVIALDPHFQAALRALDGASDEASCIATLRAWLHAGFRVEWSSWHI